jgi:hypothetical protein
MMSRAGLRAQPEGGAQGTVDTPVGPLGVPRLRVLGPEPPGEALLLGAGLPLALSFTADLAAEVGVCVHVAVLSARAWPEAPAL